MFAQRIMNTGNHASPTPRRLQHSPRVRAFTLTELMVVLGVLLVVLGLLLPALSHAKARSRRIACTGRLKNIGLGFRIFATDHQGQYPMQALTNTPGSDTPSRYLTMLSNSLSTPTILVCPADTKRRPASSFSSPVPSLNVSYFIGLDATERLPSSLLAGDRNLTTNGFPLRPGLVTLPTSSDFGWTSEMHNRQGNIAMGDGSVQQADAPRLNQLLRATGQATTRLAVP
jgi:prepilin-type processing-associated H-X9-DG protein